MSASSRDTAKGVVVTLVPTGLGFIFGGWILGVICLSLAGGLSLVLWTSFGQWLGFHDDGSASSHPDPCRELLIRERRGAGQLAHILEHFSNWWPAIKNEDFEGKLLDGYGPTTHQRAIEKFLFKFGQFFSPAWSYQSFCANHQDAAEVKALVDEVYRVLGEAGDPHDLTDARIDSDELHGVGRLGTERWGEPDARPFEEVDFKAVLKQHAGEFEALKAFLGEAGPDTSARRRLDEAAKAARAVEQWLTDNGYGP